MAERVLIVNADDFGLSPGVNAGVARAHEEGILTSASLMVRFPAAAEAAEYARGAPALSLGLHVDLGEWVYRDGDWETVYEVVSPEDADAVVNEVGRQIEAFRRLTGRDPSHIDSHQHVHSWEPAVTAFRTLAVALGVPLRHYTTGVAYCGDLYGQSTDGTPIPGAISAQALIDIIGGLPAGITELACHPGLSADSGSIYDSERAQEVEVLCDPAVREALEREGVALISFTDLPSGKAR
jgi:chitin disaccharide deacetylase